MGNKRRLVGNQNTFGGQPKHVWWATKTRLVGNQNTFGGQQNTFGGQQNTFGGQQKDVAHPTNYCPLKLGTAAIFIDNLKPLQFGEVVIRKTKTQNDVMFKMMLKPQIGIWIHFKKFCAQKTVSNIVI